MVKKIFVGLAIVIATIMLSSCSSSTAENVETASLDWCECSYANWMIGEYNSLYPDEQISVEDITENEKNRTTIRITDDIVFKVSNNGGDPTFSAEGYKTISAENRKEFFEYIRRLSEATIQFDVYPESLDRKQDEEFKQVILTSDAPISFTRGSTGKPRIEYSEHLEDDGIYPPMLIVVHSRIVRQMQ